MGKYMRKAKATGEVAVMEVSQSSLGVRTRAKTLALKRSLQKSPTAAARSDGSYLQLRSRRLEFKPLPSPASALSTGKQRQAAAKLACGRNPSLAVTAEEAVEVVETALAEKEAEGGEGVKGNDVNGDLFLGEEASFGENVLEIEARERGTRESTPCSLIRDPDVIRTPGSTTRPTSSAEINRRTQNSSQRPIPTANEMDEFFATAEVEQQKQFIDKYNFDPVNDKPLSGRYEWEKVHS